MEIKVCKYLYVFENVEKVYKSIFNIYLVFASTRSMA